MKKYYYLILMLIPVVLASPQTIPGKVEEKKETLGNIISDTKIKQNAIKETLESIEVILPKKRSVEKVRTEIKRYVRTETVFVYDTIYLPCDTLTIYTVPSPRYGGDSIQKSIWKADPNEGKIFKNLFKKKKR